MIIRFYFILLCILAHIGGAFAKQQMPLTIHTDQASGCIIDFNQSRDTQFIVEMFGRDWHWLSDEGSSYTPEWIEAYLTSAQSDKHSIKVAYAGAKPIGFVIYCKKNAECGYISFLDVSQEFRGQGWGSKLMRYAVNDLKAQGITTISLLVHRNNQSAQTLYKKIGFESVNRYPKLEVFELKVV